MAHDSRSTKMTYAGVCMRRPDGWPTAHIQQWPDVVEEIEPFAGFESGRFWQQGIGWSDGTRGHGSQGACRSFAGGAVLWQAPKLTPDDIFVMR